MTVLYLQSRGAGWALLAWVALGLVATAEPAVAAGGNAEVADGGLVHCLLPGQVRRLGAFSTSVMALEPVRSSAPPPASTATVITTPTVPACGLLMRPPRSG